MKALIASGLPPEELDTVLAWADGNAEGYLTITEDRALLLRLDWRNAARLTPLSASCMEGSLEVCRLLYEAGANVFAVDAHNNTYAHLAAKQHCPLLVAYFLDLGIDVNARNDEGRKCWSLQCGILEVTQLL